MFKKIAIPSFQNTDSVWIETYLSPEGGSLDPDYRAKIRVTIENNLASRSGEKIYTSVSHARNLGGFALSNRPVGFDLELKDRAQHKTILRVSSEKELHAAPSLTHLWAAKEAAYKSLSEFSQPAVISTIEIGEWTPSGHFKMLNENSFSATKGHGITWISDSHICAIYFF